MSPSLKRKLSIGAVVTAIACLAGGGAYAATQSGSSKTTSGDPRQAFLDDVAGRLHVSVTDLQAALKGAAADQVDAAVKAGKLTQAEADAIKKKIEQGGRVPFPGPFFGLAKPAPGAPKLFRGPFAHRLPAPAFRGPFGHRLPAPAFAGPFGPMGGRGIIKAGFDAAAKYLGLSNAQIKQRLASGKSLADVAKAQGKSVDGLTSAIKAVVKARLDSAVSAKKITQAQETRILDFASSAIDNVVNGKLPRDKPFFGPRLKFRHGG